MDISLETLSIQANDRPKCAVSATLNDNATLPRRLPGLDNCVDRREDSAVWGASFKHADDPQGLVDEQAGTQVHLQHSSQNSTTFLSLPIEIRDMILKSIFGGRKVHVTFECLSSRYIPWRSNVSPSRWREGATRRPNTFPRMIGPSMRSDIHFSVKA